MMKFIFALLFCLNAMADTTIGQLPLKPASGTTTNDSLPFVSTAINQTDRVRLWDLPNLPPFQTIFTLLIPSQTGNSGKCLKSNGTITVWQNCIVFGAQTKNTVYSGPSSGSDADPSFRSLVGADLPNPGPSSLGGVQSYSAVSNQWINSISTLGVPSSSQPAFTDISGTSSATQGGTGQSTYAIGDTLYSSATNVLSKLSGNTTTTKKYLSQTGTGAASQAPSWLQPACGDLSNAAASCSTDATNASNISSGTLPAARLPNPSASTLGGVESYAAVTSQWIRAISTLGVPSSSQPACGDLSNAATSCSTDATNASNISTGTLALARGGTHADLSATGGTSQVLKQTSVGGNVTVAQLACADLSNSATSCSTDTTNAANISSGLLAVARGGTGIASGTSGGVPYYSASGTIASSGALTQHAIVLGGGAGATPSVLGSLGTSTTLLHGAAAGDPTFGAVALAADVSGTLPVANGGTGQTSYTDGQLMIGNTATGLTSKATLSPGANITITNGNGTVTIAASSTATPAYTYVSQSSTLNPAVIGDYYLLSGSSFTITLPTAASISGQSVIFQHNGTSLTQVYTFNTTSSQTINGPGGTVASGSYALYTNGERLILYSDGSNWQVVQHDTASAEADAGAIALTASSHYVFTLASSASITIGTIFTSNSNTFYVSATSSSSTTLNCYGTGSPGASGTLTFVSGSPSGNKTFNSVSTGTQAKGSATYEKFIWHRKGNLVFFRWDAKWGAGTAGTGDYGFFFPTGLLPDTTNMQTSLTVLSSTLTGGVVPSIFAYSFLSSSVATYAYLFMGNSAIFKVIVGGNGAWNGGVAGALSNAVSFSFNGSYPVTGWQP